MCHCAQLVGNCIGNDNHCVFAALLLALQVACCMIAWVASRKLHRHFLRCMPH